MNPRSLIAIAFVLPGAALTSCGLFSSDTAGPAQVDDLVGWVERVYVESELSKDNVQVSVTKLQAIVSAEFGANAVQAYTEFVESVDRAEQQADKLRDTIGPMKSAAEPVFEKWEEDLEQFSSPAMRERSFARMTATRERYEQIVAAVEPAQVAYDELVAGLRDHALFLGNDFNPGALSAVQEDVRRLSALAAEIDGRFDAALMAARAYVDSSALPGNVAAPPGGAPQGQQPQPQQTQWRQPQPQPQARPPQPQPQPQQTQTQPQQPPTQQWPQPQPQPQAQPQWQPKPQAQPPQPRPQTQPPTQTLPPQTQPPTQPPSSGSTGR